jgi:hypothetical protein
MLADERRAGLEYLSSYVDFASRVQRTKREILSGLIKAKEEVPFALRITHSGGNTSALGFPCRRVYVKLEGSMAGTWSSRYC